MIIKGQYFLRAFLDEILHIDLMKSKIVVN